MMVGLPNAGQLNWLAGMGYINNEALDDEVYVVLMNDIRKDVLRKNGIGENEYDRFHERDTEIYHNAINLIIDRISYARNRGINLTVCVDGQFLTVNARKAFIHALRFKTNYSVNFEFSTMFFNTPLRTLLKNNEDNTGYDYLSEDDIKELYYGIEAPSKSEEDLFCMKTLVQEKNRFYIRSEYYEGFLIRQNDLKGM